MNKESVSDGHIIKTTLLIDVWFGGLNLLIRCVI